MTLARVKIGRREIREGVPPYVIAEIGVNHEGSLDRAKEMVTAARKGGADAAKFQTYKAERLASRDSPAYWDLSAEPTTSQFQLFKKWDTFGRDEYESLAEHCVAEGIHFLSTPFDLEAVDFLVPLMPAFKIASADLTNVPLLRAVGRRGKPVILSTGASTLPEIESAVRVLEGEGCESIVLLHCVLSYPTAYEDANLGMIRGLRRAFPDRLVGYSDHTVPDEGMTVLLSAYLKGASVIEKHFTFDKGRSGNDHYHAMDEQDLKVFHDRVRFCLRLEGDGEKRVVGSEEPARLHARRSIVTKRAIAQGSRIGPEDLICKRPGKGISPLHWDEVVGRVAGQDLDEDVLVAWDDLA